MGKRKAVVTSSIEGYDPLEARAEAERLQALLDACRRGDAKLPTPWARVVMRHVKAIKIRLLEDQHPEAAVWHGVCLGIFLKAHQDGKELRMVMEEVSKLKPEAEHGRKAKAATAKAREGKQTKTQERYAEINAEVDKWMDKRKGNPKLSATWARGKAIDTLKERHSGEKEWAHLCMDTIYRADKARKK